jgi:glycerol-3-phosphate acyltransferase PlsX
MRLAIDVMGGDHAPAAPIQGALAAAERFPDIDFVLVGQRSAISAQLPQLPQRFSVEEAADVIASDAEPVRAVRRQPDSSMVVSARLLRDGAVQGVVSAGNTGALLVSGLLVVGRMDGMDRPALAAFLPTFSGRGVLLIDAGANMDCSPSQLVQFAKMGQAYMQLAHDMQEVRVGLANIGTEANKGNDLCKAAHALLRDECPGFIGNIESREMLSDACEVVVCDGFVGNMLVKFYEGIGLGLLKGLREVFSSTLGTRLAGLAVRMPLRAYANRFDYVQYGGGPLLGVRGIVLKAHGSSSPQAFVSVIAQAHRMHVSGLMGALEQQFRDRSHGGG